MNRLIVLCLLIGILGCSSEYNGRSADGWVDTWLRTESLETRRQALDVIIHRLGPRSFPALVRRFGDQDFGERAVALAIIVLNSERFAVSAETDGFRVTPNPDPFSGRPWKRAASELKGAMRSHDPIVRKRAAFVSGCFGPSAGPLGLVPGLWALCNDDVQEVKATAERALVEAGALEQK